MKFAIKNAAACAVFTAQNTIFPYKKMLLHFLAASTFATVAHAHVTLEQPVALSGTSYKAVLRVGHGCAGLPTREVIARVPEGFRGAKPMPKPGWTLHIERAPLAKPYAQHGREVTEDVVQVRWVANSPAHFLANEHFDEFALRGQLAQPEGPMWFKVLQNCQDPQNPSTIGQLDWSQTPAQGTSSQGLKSPAALLEILPAGAATGHAH